MKSLVKPIVILLPLLGQLLLAVRFLNAGNSIGVVVSILTAVMWIIAVERILK